MIQNRKGRGYILEKWPTYKKFSQPQVDTMGEVIDLMEKVRMQGFREAIEVLEEMDRADHMATRYISVLKQLHDAAVLSSKPPTKRRA